jgi:anti-sigma factor RsiW
MSTDDKYSDEKLHMFIDDEMNNSDRARMMEAINKDEQLSNRVCELMQLKDTVRLAYNELPKSSHSASHRDTAFRTGTWLNAAAAVLLLAIGTLGGWTLYPTPSTWLRLSRHSKKTSSCISANPTLSSLPLHWIMPRSF